MIKCLNCNREYNYDRNKGHRKTLCNSCVTTLRINNFKDSIYNSFNNKCQICGYSKCRQALCFHHLNPQTKNFEIADSWRYTSKEKIIKEIEKCILICSNCHAEIHTNTHIL